MFKKNIYFYFLKISTIYGIEKLFYGDYHCIGKLFHCHRLPKHSQQTQYAEQQENQK